MYSSFEELPAHARVWIYQADRKLTPNEVNAVSATMKDFCGQWAAHGQPLMTSFKMEHSQFLVVSVDEGIVNASGCSIDGSVRVLKGLQAELNVNFLDSSWVAFLLDGEIQLFSRLALKGLFAQGKVNASTITFNNLVATKADFERQWKIAVEKSWMAKYLPNPTLIK
jgi:hypothetical protein